VLTERLEAEDAISKRTTESATEEDAIIQSWSGGTIDSCEATINSSSSTLKSFAAQYDLVMMCGTVRPDADRMTDRSISVSKRYTIERRAFNVAMPISNAMRGAITALAAHAQRPSVTRGTPLSFEVMLWYEVALVPKGLDLSMIRTLADVERFGGKRFPDHRRGTNSGCL
jgi:hypothetical protein